MNKRIIAGALCAAMLCSGTAFAAEVTTDTAETADDTAVTMPAEAAPYAVSARVTLAAVAEDSLTVTTAEGEELILNLSDETVIVDNQAAIPVGLDALKAGDALYVWHGAQMTMSLPAQTHALAILTNVGETTPAVYHVVEQAKLVETAGTALCDHGSMLLNVDADTAFTPYATRQIVTANDLRMGARVLAWYEVATLSLPAQAHPDRVMLLPVDFDTVPLTAAVGEATFETKRENNTVMIPARAVGEALGYKVGYHAENGVEYVSIASESGALNMTIGEDGYSYGTTVPGMTGLTAPLPYGAAPYLAKNEAGLTVTWMSAQALELLGHSVSLVDDIVYID